MNILIPLTVTDAMLTASSLAEPAAGETAWVSAGTYVLADQRIRATTHKIYECIQAHTGRATLPEADPLYWEAVGPTAKWAPFDSYVSTAATASASLSYTLTPGFFDAVGLYGLAGSSLTLTVKDGPGGATLHTETISLYEAAAGLYEYLFAPARPVSKVIVTDLPLHPTAELAVAVTGAGAVAIGILNAGLYRRLVDPAKWGGTEYGASVEPMSYSRIKTDEFGNTFIKRGLAATGMRASVVLPTEAANFALASIQQVLDVPVSWVATSVAGYEGLNVFGLGSATLTYNDYATVTLALTVKGMI